MLDLTKATLVRTDKNGTKYYEGQERCLKCHGTGTIPVFMHVYGGECFDCRGSGWLRVTTKVYTPEYEKVLEEKARKRNEKAREERILKIESINKEFLAKQGFDSDGHTYIVSGDTYLIKDRLKEAGAIYNNMLGWHFSAYRDDFSVWEISWTDVMEIDAADGTYIYRSWKEIDGFLSILRAMGTVKYVSEYQYTVGEKITVELTLVKQSGFDTNFGYQMIYKFEDNDHNIYIWKTGTGMDMQAGETKIIKATVKEHKEYKGDKQTVITRCRIA